MPVQLTFTNPPAVWTNVPDYWLAEGLDAFLAEWRDVQTGAALETGVREAPYAGFPPLPPGDMSVLRASEVRLMLVDVSTLRGILNLQPGTYDLQVAALRVALSELSNTVQTSVRALTEAEEQTRSQLIVRRFDAPLPDRWPLFLESNPTTLSAPLANAFGEDVRPIMRFYLWLHRALWGPIGPEGLQVGELDGLATGVFEAEVAALKYELVVARRDPGAGQIRQAMLGKWPGLRWRLERVDEGKGFLTIHRERIHRGGLWRSLKGEEPYTQNEYRGLLAAPESLIVDDYPDGRSVATLSLIPWYTQFSLR
jgi:hypothetical protein